VPKTYVFYRGPEKMIFEKLYQKTPSFNLKKTLTLGLRKISILP